jgi:hypothetical protein
VWVIEEDPVTVARSKLMRHEAYGENTVAVTSDELCVQEDDFAEVVQRGRGAIH